jgi:hypothetical protein
MNERFNFTVSGCDSHVVYKAKARRRILYLLGLKVDAG